MVKKLRTDFATVICIFLITTMSSSCRKDDKNSPADATGPYATTNEATNVGQGWATLNGTINPNNKITYVLFEYDTTTACRLKAEANPDTISDNKVTYVKTNLTGLLPGTKYYFRIIAVSEGDTSNGAEKTFTTTNPCPISINYNQDITYGSVADIEGNIYRTVVVGTIEWMAENLRTSRLNDGTPVSFVPDASEWNASTFTYPGYCWYNNDSVSYGALYNWYSVNTGKLCPAGWHVPSDDEWNDITGVLGGKDIAGGKLKEKGLSHWFSPNAGATNESGFTALPGGYRYSTGSFNGIGRFGYWWTSTPFSEKEAYYRIMTNSYSNIERSSSSKKSGMSVRCIRDNRK